MTQPDEFSGIVLYIIYKKTIRMTQPDEYE